MQPKAGMKAQPCELRSPRVATPTELGWANELL